MREIISRPDRSISDGRAVERKRRQKKKQKAKIGRDVLYGLYGGSALSCVIFLIAVVEIYNAEVLYTKCSVVDVKIESSPNE